MNQSTRAESRKHKDIIDGIVEFTGAQRFGFWKSIRKTLKKCNVPSEDINYYKKAAFLPDCFFKVRNEYILFEAVVSNDLSLNKIKKMYYFKDYLNGIRDKKKNWCGLTVIKVTRRNGMLEFNNVDIYDEAYYWKT